MQSLNVATEGQNHIQSSNPNAPWHVSCDTMEYVHQNSGYLHHQFIALLDKSISSSVETRSHPTQNLKDPEYVHAMCAISSRPADWIASNYVSVPLIGGRENMQANIRNLPKQPSQ